MDAVPYPVRGRGAALGFVEDLLEVYERCAVLGGQSPDNGDE
jgi:hypothetical protein